MATFNLFVYGTLMHGFRANSFIPEGSKMLKGKIAGNLYHYIAGYPIVEILKPSTVILGSSDYQKDVSKQDDFNRLETVCLPFDLNYGRVHGELYQIPVRDKEEITEIIDRLDSYEGFTPESRHNLYNRTLVPVQTSEGIIWGWVYNMDILPRGCVHIMSGDWTDCFYTNHGGLRPELKKAIDRSIQLEEKDDFLDKRK